MTNPEFIRPVLGSTTPDPGKPRVRVRAIPQDVLVQASRRLGIMSLVGLALWVLGALFYHLSLLTIPDRSAHWLDLTFSDAACAVAMLSSLGLFYYTRRENRNPQFILDMGLAYMVM